MAGAPREKRRRPTGPPSHESLESEGTREIPGCDPRGVQLAGASSGVGPTSKAGGGAGISAASAAAARPSRRAAGIRPRGERHFSRPGRQEAGAGRRGRARDLGPGDSADGREGTYYLSAGLGFQKFLLFPGKFRRRSPEGRQNSHLGEKAGIQGRAFLRNRVQGALRTPSSPESWPPERPTASLLSQTGILSVQLREELGVGEMWNLAVLGSVSGSVPSFNKNVMTASCSSYWCRVVN